MTERDSLSFMLSHGELSEDEESRVKSRLASVEDELIQLWTSDLSALECGSLLRIERRPISMARDGQRSRVFRETLNLRELISRGYQAMATSLVLRSKALELKLYTETLHKELGSARTKS